MVLVAFTDTLEAQELDAAFYLSESKNNMRLFLEVVQAIFEGGLWKQEFSNWNEYCKAKLPKGASRIRQMRSAQRTIQLVESVSSLTPVIKEVNWMKDIIPQEQRHMMPQVYKLAHDLCKGKLARRHVQAAYDVELELSVTGTISIDGISVPPTPLNRLAAHKEIQIEVDKRHNDHRRGSSKRQAISVTFGELTWIDGVLRLIVNESISLQDAELLASGTHKVYIERDKDNE